MDQEKLKTAYHEACHAVMAMLHGLKIGRVSIKGTEKYRGVTSTEPPEREVNNPRDALREVRISLSGFVGEVFISGKYSIYATHSDLTGAIELIEQLIEFDDGFKNFVAKIAATKPSDLTFIENPLVRASVEEELRGCHQKLTPHKAIIKLIAERLYEVEELSGVEINSLISLK